jgi:hypothetical protein
MGKIPERRVNWRKVFLLHFLPSQNYLFIYELHPNRFKADAVFATEADPVT